MTPLLTRIREIDENYKIREDGQVLSRTRKGTKGGAIRSWIDGNGYVRVRLFSDGKWRVTGVHRLLAQAFIPNPNSLPEVNHKDGNPQNNALSNLEWVTGRENQRHAYLMGLRVQVSCSGEKYIYWEKTTKKWRVIITNVDGTRSRLGRFTSLQEAIEAREKFLGEILGVDALAEEESSKA